MFNLDEIIPHFDRINRKHYLGELLAEASTSELHQFKKEVKAHQRKSKFIQDLHYMPKMSVHDTIIATINYLLLKRSKWFCIYKALLPLRKKLVSWFSGVDLKEHPYCGVLYVKRQNRKSFLHITMPELILILKKFWLLHWKWIIGITVPSILAIIGLYIEFLALKPKP
ncbi:MAG: hypothetical protein LWX08_14825 [Deltaproteobacteria bacterium]|jgi:hypothetical protein|nr:hypothetical protein [Deltaproteobacteria bacterium]